MDSSSEKNINGGLMFKPNRPHFFKIILNETIRDKKLCIPRKFARSYGNDLPSIIVLKVPSGAKWQVELAKYDDEIWLQDGWQEFMEYYSISYGSFLVFSYDKKPCIFNVIIFDKSASEIDYPFCITNEDNESNLEKDFQEPEIQEIEDDASVEILPCRRTRQKSPLPFSQPHKKMKLANPTRNRNNESSTGQFQGTDSEIKKGNGGLSGKRKRLKRNVPGKISLTHEEKVNAIQRASTNFKSDNPSFMIAMQPSTVDPEYKPPTIPSIFARKYLHKNPDKALLNALDGRTWPVEYYTQMSRGKPRARMSCGWKEFAKDNHLEIEDVCAFELISCAETTFRVSIFRSKKTENCSLSSFGKKKLKPELNHGRASSSIPPGAIAPAKIFTTRHTSFRVAIRSYHLKHNHLYVPREFMSEYKNQSTENIMLVVESRQWPVKIISCPPYNHGRLSTGWCLFAKENSLQVGDTCIFRLIVSKSVLIKVSTLRHVRS